jgi:cyclopropane fatty-acyl-phospholipid synthase-like methyltransferase
MSLDLRAAWRAWHSFRGIEPRVRAFLLARILVAGLGPMGRGFRLLRGRILSLGAGHGLVDRYLTEINPDVTIEGVDLDAQRVARAIETEDRYPRVRIRVADVTELEPDVGYDGALAIDVIHHVPRETHRHIVRALLRALRPGGVLLVKDMATTPRRQYWWNRFHDRVVVGPHPISCYSPEAMAQMLEEEGFRIDEVTRINRSIGLYPHYMVVARKPEADGARS